MISPQGEQVRNQMKNVIGPMLKAMLETPLETRRPQFEALMGRTELPPDVEIEEVEAGGVPCEWVRIAGGGLSLATLVALRDAGDPLLAGAILLSAATDLAASGASHSTNVESDLIDTPALITEVRTCYLGDRDPRTPLASPLYANLEGLPPLLIQVGSDELLRDDSTQVAERAQAVGVPVTLHIGEGMWHGWQATSARMPFPEGQVALQQIGDFVDQLSGNVRS